jgi:hypothetical protein
MSAIFFPLFLFLAVMALPIAFALALAGAGAIILSGATLPLTTIPQRMFAAVDSFPFLAIPFFILIGDMMSSGGAPDRPRCRRRRGDPWRPSCHNSGRRVDDGCDVRLIRRLDCGYGVCDAAGDGARAL